VKYENLSYLIIFIYLLHSSVNVFGTNYSSDNNDKEKIINYYKGKLKSDISYREKICTFNNLGDLSSSFKDKANYFRQSYNLATYKKDEKKQIQALRDLINTPYIDSLKNYYLLSTRLTDSPSKSELLAQYKVQILRYKTRIISKDDLTNLGKKILHETDSLYNIENADLYDLYCHYSIICNIIRTIQPESIYFKYLIDYKRVVEAMPSENKSLLINYYIAVTFNSYHCKNPEQTAINANKVIDFLETRNIKMKQKGRPYYNSNALESYMSEKSLSSYNYNTPSNAKRAYTFLKKSNSSKIMLYSLYYQMTLKNYKNSFDISEKMIQSKDSTINHSDLVNIQIDAIKHLDNKANYASNLIRDYDIYIKEQKEKNLRITRQYALLNEIEQLKTNNERLSAENTAALLEKHRNNCRILTLVILVILLLFIGLLLHSVIQHNHVKAIKAKEKELRAARKLAENASKTQSMFMHNMSHEIRTPLNAIVGFSKLLAIDEETSLAEKKHFCEIIQSNCSWLLQLVNDILDLAHLEAGKYSMVYSNKNLYNICNNLISSMQNRVSDKVVLKLDYKLDKDYSLYTDTDRLKQIVSNFITNSCKYTKEGSIILGCELVLKNEKEFIAFIVTDTGTGIPPEQRDKIFERFTKLNSNVKGTGLGLNICKSLCNLFQGELELDTSYTEGARFIFYHPIS